MNETISTTLESLSDLANLEKAKFVNINKTTSIALVAIWAMFCAFGIGLHHRALHTDNHGQHYVSIAGFDGEGYLNTYCHIGNALRMKKRHPAYALITSPAFVVGSMLTEKVGMEPAKIAVIALFAAVSALTVWMLYLVTADIGAVAIFLSFAYVWLLAGSPELFAISQTILMGTVLMVKRRVRDPRAWAGMTLLAGGTTITNFIKPIAAWCVLALNDRKAVSTLRRFWRRIVIAFAVIAALGSAFEIFKWYFIDGLTPKEEFDMAIDYVMRWFGLEISGMERIRRLWEMFFCEPLMTHGAIFNQVDSEGNDLLPLGYSCCLPHIVCGITLALSLWSCWRNRCNVIVQAVMAMVSFDIALHVLIGWGLLESQIYCGHWMYAIPILLASLRGKWWKFSLAAVIMFWNLAQTV